MPRGKPGWAWFEGKIVPFADARLPLEDRGVQFGESLYEVIAVIGGVPFRLADHVERLRSAASELGLQAGIPAAGEWLAMIAELHRREPRRSAVLYAQLTGGDAPRAHVPERAPRPRFFAYMRARDFPTPADAARGISAITVPESRWRRSDLKTTMLLPAVLARREAAMRGAEEALFIGQDGVLDEGTASTLFLVRDRVVSTPLETHRVLHGVSTLVVRELCADLGLQFQTRPLTLADLSTADEVFLASTMLLLMPVVRLDGREIGGGTPGPVALQLAYHFHKRFWSTAQ